MEYDNKKVLGTGVSAQVFLGTFAGEDVAVKKILKRAGPDVDEARQNREEEAMKTLDHPNVLKLIEVQEDSNFKYLILELCLGTVRDYIRGDYTGPMPSEIDGMIQMASGLQYIHSNKLVHRDIKPENVLISASHVLKISDFGVCRPVTGSGSFSMNSGPRGTRIYNSPEFLRFDEKSPEERETIRANVSIDTFSLGCLFFGYITKGGHPFASAKSPSEFQTIANIYNGEKHLGPRASELGLSDDHYALPVIDGMTKVDPNARWTLELVFEILENQKSKLAQDAYTKK